MGLSDDATETHRSGFLAMLDERFRSYGSPAGLPEALRKAVAEVPRHRFVHRFRSPHDGPLQDFDAAPEPHLALVYSDAVMTHVDAQGEALRSTNSQPSYVLWLIAQLDLGSGQRVLEIGSGSGWLAAVMARLVGSEGHVTGVEILPDLAAQSRADLDETGLGGNVTIIAGDGTTGIAGGPFDAVMITAATWDLTAGIMDSVADGGVLLVPVAMRGGGCQVTILKREGARFVERRRVVGSFVPLVGPGQAPAQNPRRLEDLPGWAALGSEPTRIYPFGLASFGPGLLNTAALAFANYLRMHEPEAYVAIVADAPDARPSAFGLFDATVPALALWREQTLAVYGGDGPARRTAKAYEQWFADGMPGPQAYAFSVVRAAEAPARSDTTRVEMRGDSALVWRLRPDARTWRILLEP